MKQLICEMCGSTDLVTGASPVCALCEADSPDV